MRRLEKFLLGVAIIMGIMAILKGTVGGGFIDPHAERWIELPADSISVYSEIDENNLPEKVYKKEGYISKAFLGEVKGEDAVIIIRADNPDKLNNLFWREIEEISFLYEIIEGDLVEYSRIIQDGKRVMIAYII